MGFFTEATKVIELDEANTVTIRRLNWKQKKRIQDVMMRPALNMDIAGESQQRLTSQFDMVGAQAETLRLGIAAWSGPGFEGQEPNAENVLDLPEEIADRILKEIDGFNTVTDAEKKALTGASSTP